ncbi:MAG: MlaD family protein [Rickettsiales bacterium]|jgi:phospholipid/cholesterol/gamma-HCH transport system substrate-binding protein|nr:MlaD family protein [Rickettsiales bacterium]
MTFYQHGGKIRLWARILAVLALVLIYSRGGRDESMTLRANFDRADGLEPGAPVRLSGIEIGKVAGLRLKSDYSVDVAMKVSRGAKIPEDSQAFIFTDGLLGAKYIEISAGGSGEFMLEGADFDYTQGSVDLPFLIGRGVESIIRGQSSSPGRGRTSGQSQSSSPGRPSGQGQSSSPGKPSERKP